MHTWAPILLAMGAAVLIAAGTVLRQRASAASGAITAGWSLGAAVALAGFLLQATALGLGSILVVQPLVVLTVLFALPMEAWFDHRRLRRSEWVWGLTLVACVVGFLIVAKPISTDRRPHMLVMVITVSVLIIGLIAVVWNAEYCRSAHFRALSYGCAAGALFGVSSLLIKAVAIRVIDDPLSVFRHAELYLLVIVVVLAIVAQQRGFGAGDLQTSFPAMNVMEPVVAIVLGVALLGETVHVGAPSVVSLVVVGVIAGIAVVRLAQEASDPKNSSRTLREEHVPVVPPA